MFLFIDQFYNFIACYFQEVRPGFFPSVPIGRGVPLLGPGPGPGHGSAGGPRIGPGGMMGNNNVPGLPGNMGPGPEFGKHMKYVKLLSRMQ